MGEYRMFQHANGVKHRYKKRSHHEKEERAKEEAQKWKNKHYYIRIIKRTKGYDVYAFNLQDH